MRKQEQRSSPEGKTEERNREARVERQDREAGTEKQCHELYQSGEQDDLPPRMTNKYLRLGRSIYDEM